MNEINMREKGCENDQGERIETDRRMDGYSDR